MTGTLEPFFANHPSVLAEKKQQEEFMAKFRADMAQPQNDLARKALEMRNAIGLVEGALMCAGDLVDIPDKFTEAREDLLLMPKITLRQLRRISTALSECTRIVNDDEYSPAQFSGGTCSGGEG